MADLELVESQLAAGEQSAPAPAVAALPPFDPLAEIRHVADLPVEVCVELDRKSMSLQEILDLKVGSTLKMTRSAGENVDILVEGTIVGFGEIVVIEDSMGIRLTDFKTEE